MTTTAPLETAEGENDHRNDFMINVHKSYVAELGFELASLDYRLHYGAQFMYMLCDG